VTMAAQPVEARGRKTETEAVLVSTGDRGWVGGLAKLGL
jgi:hypothetical protein